MKKESIGLKILDELKEVCKDNDSNCAMDYELRERTGFSNKELSNYLENLSKLGLLKRGVSVQEERLYTLQNTGIE